MTNPQKVKGSQWERDACKLLNEAFPSTWKRVALSGALGTMLNIPILRPDAIGEYAHLSRKIVGEAKVGYGGKSMTIQKDWWDGIEEIAEENYALPAVLLKFEKSRTGVRHVICLSFEAWDALMQEMSEMHHELLMAYEKLDGQNR